MMAAPPPDLAQLPATPPSPANVVFASQPQVSPIAEAAAQGIQPPLSLEPERFQPETEQPETEQAIAQQFPVPEAIPPTSELPQESPESSRPEFSESVPESPPQSSPSEASVTLKTIQVNGSQIFSPGEFDAWMAPFLNKPLAPTDLRAIADTITQHYLNQGYITSRALDPVVSGDRATVQIVEGAIEQIEITGTERVSQDYIRRRIELAAQQPLNTNRLEEQLKLLRNDPLFEELSASLRAGDGLGQSVLAVTVKEAQSFTAEASVDNYSPPSVGSERFGTQLQYRNLTGNGDVLSGGYTRSRTGGSQQVNLSYSTPVNPREGTLSLSADWTRTKITQDEFESLNITGNSQRYSLQYRQPLLRSLRQELALSAGFTFQDGQTFLDGTPTPFGAGPDADGISRTAVINFGQDYVKRDPSGAWALRSQFNLGTGLFDATNNAEPMPDGQFLSWLGQVQRVQRLGDNHLVIAQGSLQLSSDALLASQQFSLGGGQSLRGYRQNVRSGDNGFRVSVEDRITLQRDAGGASTVQLAPFAEVGKVWNDVDNPSGSGTALLASAGVGVIWKPTPASTIRVDYGVPLVSLGDRGNNLQDQGVHFSASYRF